ncbi:suppressor of cytokine signaling 7-like isoform X2 [Electrophorus electricus]|uniref:suppressor of cytokine signaling 7-like isoform X2 n=1 Tax=Electrophorus electricus TaxID=8005 RepID=UPI0015CFD63D|nr:suppressor of cytokine signaling 7-like isoform X2 [Electrophorus electricus]
MTNAQDMSPDFVLMRLVSAAEHDHLDEEDILSRGGVIPGFGKSVLGHHRHNIGNGFRFDRGNSTAGPATLDPSHSQQESGTGTLDDGATAIRPALSRTPPPPDFSVSPRFEFPHGATKGSRAQLMVFQSLLRPGDGVLECGVEEPRDSDKQGVSGVSLPRGAVSDTTNYGTDTHQSHAIQRFQWTPVLKLTKVDANEAQEGLCQRHRLISDTPEWVPLGDKTLHFGTTHAHKPVNATGSCIEDPVLHLARRLRELGQGSDVLRKDGDIPLCSCKSVLASATRAHPGEDPSETSDALLVLEGLGAEEVELSPTVCHSEGLKRSSVGQPFSQHGGDGVDSSLSGLMQQVQCLAGGGSCTSQPSPAVPDSSGSPSRPLTDCPVLPLSGPLPQDTAGVTAPLSRPPTPKHVGSPLDLMTCRGQDAHRGSRVKSRKGSLKVCLSKLFRTKSSSSSSNVGHGTEKRPSLDSSTSSTGSLVDVWGASSLEPDTGRSLLARPQSACFLVPFTGETMSLVDVDISRRGANSLHPPTPPPPPRRSLSLLDDFRGRPPGMSRQSLSLPPPTHTSMQQSLSLNDTFLCSVPQPVPHQPDSRSATQLEQRPLLCPLSRPDAGNFATSLRELEKCGWYWGPMNWEDAEMKLKHKPDGSFLVRDSSDPRYILSLSFRSQGVTHHTRMEHYRGTFSLWCHPKFEDRCHSVVEFVERAIMHSKNGRFLYFLRSRVPGLPPTPVQLLYPVSRFSSVKSLQHLCRFCIRQLVRVDHIQQLPLPTPLIVYLRKFYFYDPEEEKYLSGRDRGVTQESELHT